MAVLVIGLDGGQSHEGPGDDPMKKMYVWPGAAGVAVFGASAVYGFREIGRCKQQREHELLAGKS